MLFRRPVSLRNKCVKSYHMRTFYCVKLLKYIFLVYNVLTCRKLELVLSRLQTYSVIPGCVSPQAPTNGVIASSTGTNLGDNVVYACNAGYQLTGSSTSVCSASGVWDPGIPTCDISGKIIR